MNKYKRWILILTAALTVFVVHVESLRATSLIHAGKFSKLLNGTTTSNSTNSSTTTSSSSTTEGPSSDRLRALLDELPDDSDSVIDVNGTKITLTGIPQIDYVWDPNLPRELNGFNLSTYPFLDSMPADEDIDFNCDDKINGFYASIKYSCQLYHHCLYGVRSDFICANFTAFDQKTFICHFVSEVDCKNSYKYWNRNDDLYKATTTTTSSTLMPLFDRGFYNRTRHSFLNGGNNSGSSSVSSQNNNNSPQSGSDSSSSSSTGQLSSNNNNKNNNNSNNSPPAQSNGNNNNNNGDDFYNNRPQRPLRRPPYRRRRPPVDYYYYDDDYEDEAYDERGRRRNRPRNRRPIYDDYDDSRRPDVRRPYYDDFDDYEYERRPLRSRNRPESRNNNSNKSNIDEKRRFEDRRAGDRRRPAAYDDDRRPAIDDRRPAIDERRAAGDDRRRNTDRKPALDERRFGNEERRFSDDRQDDKTYSRRNPLSDDKRVRPHQQPEALKQSTDESISTEEKLTKPLGSIFDRARPPPKIRPVPLSERGKFAYKSESRNKDKSEEYEEYDDAPLSSSTTTTTQKSSAAATVASSTPKPFSFQKLKPATSTTTKATSTTAAQAEAEYYDDEYYDTVTPTQRTIESSSSRGASYYSGGSRTVPSTVAATTTTTTTAAPSPDSFRLNRYKNDNSRENVQQQSNLQSFIDPLTTTKKAPLLQPSIISNSGSNNKKYANKQTVFEHVTQETPAVRVSPQNYFQNLYNSRNLEKAEVEVEQEQQKPTVRVVKRPFLPSRGGNPYKARGLQPVGVLAEQQQNNQDNGIDVRQASDSTAKITLEDLYNEEYDVDLNDALNPMLKPLTSSRHVSSFSQGPSTDASDTSHKILHKADHYSAPKSSQTTSATTSTTPQPEYYDDELEYTYADDVA